MSFLFEEGRRGGDGRWMFGWAAAAGGGSATTSLDNAARVRRRRKRGLWLEGGSRSIVANFVSTWSFKLWRPLRKHTGRERER